MLGFGAAMLGLNNKRERMVFVGGKINQHAASAADISIDLTGLTGGIASAPAAGDYVLIAFGFGANDNVDRDLAITGFTEIFDRFGDDTSDVHLIVAEKTMGSSPDTTATAVGGTFGASNLGISAIQVWRNATRTVGASVSAANTNTCLPNPPSVTPTKPGSRVAVFGIGARGTSTSDVTFSSPDLPDYFASADNTSSGSNNGCAIGHGWKKWTSGAIDPAAFTLNGGSDATTYSQASASIVLEPL